MSRFSVRTLAAATLLLLAGLVFSLSAQAAKTEVAMASSSASAARPLVEFTTINASCPSPLGSFTTTYQKIANIGVFNVVSSGSVVEATYNGRISVESFASSSGAVFELRVDNLAPPVGRSRAIVKASEAGSSPGVPVSMTGIFPDLATGSHTLSMWVRSSAGTGSTAMFDPGCWSSDHVVIAEHRPFGSVYLPLVQR